MAHRDFDSSAVAAGPRSRGRPAHGREQAAACGGDAPERERPLLLVDVDGVLSLFGFDLAAPPPGSFHAVEGIPHFISRHGGELLLRLAASFELVWASGWEERANEHLRPLIELPRDLPYLSFARRAAAGDSLRAHWKLDAIDSYAPSAPLAWVDDAFNEACEQWAAERAAPTLLVATQPAIGLTQEHAAALERWAVTLDGQRA